jgi:chromosome segregation ATPase
METPLERVLKEIDEIKEKIEKVEIERNDAAGLLKAAVTTGQAADIRQDLRALLESADKDLHDLRQEELKLIERQTVLETAASLPSPADITGVVSSYLLV